MKSKVIIGIMLTLLFMGMLSLAFDIRSLEAESGPKIDVYTQKGGEGPNQPDGFFMPDQFVDLIALVTDNDDPVADNLVTFKVKDPNGETQAQENAITNESGIAHATYRIFAPWWLNNTFGIWNATAETIIASQTVCDTVTFEVGWYVEITSVETGVWLDEVWIPKTEFNRLEPLDVKMSYIKVCEELLNVTFYIVAYDDCEVPILWWNSSYTLSGPMNETLFIHMGTIPIWAYCGNGKVYANAFNRPIEDGVWAYCPEVYCEFEIVPPQVHHVYLGQSIQVAINSAQLGDTIFVHAGTYHENIIVNKSVCLFGENRETTIIDGNGTGTVINVTANNVLMNKFTVRRSGVWPNSGVSISAVNGCSILDNLVTGNSVGIAFYRACDNTVSGNNITSNTYGIVMYPISSNTSNSNHIFNNYFANSINAADSGDNYWNGSKALGMNIISGQYLGGNYWNDYSGVDIDADGIGDTNLPYNCSGYIGKGGDWLPLVYDVYPPVINILSPQNVTYTSSSVSLTFTVNEPTSWAGYSLDNQANVTITGNTTLTGLVLGSHNIIVYANDTYGNMGSSNKVYFTRIVNDVAILNVTASPTETYVNQIVNINVTVKNKGTVSETFNVTAYYDLNAVDTQTVVNLALGSNITITFSWNTSSVQKGTYTIKAEADVVPGETNTTDNIFIGNTVTILNRAPTIDSFTPVDTTPEVNKGDSLEFTHTSSDPDDDSLTYSWLLDSVEQATTQNWTYSPDYDDAGTHNVTLVVSDGELTDSQEWSVTVHGVNRPPVIDTFYPSTDPTISEGESQEFNITYHDPDGDMVSVHWYLNGTPTVTTDSYTFVAVNGSAGTYNITVTISDGFAQTSHEWTLTVGIQIVEVPMEGGEKAIIEGNVTMTNVVVTNNTLDFEVSGLSGSTGWINVTFPMINTTNIEVFINKVKLTPPPFPVITTNGTHYFIYFEFTLSTHTITIQFGPTVPVGGIYIPVNKLELLAPYIGLTILLVVAVMTVGYVKKRKRKYRN